MSVEKSENPYLALSGFSTISGLISAVRLHQAAHDEALSGIYMDAQTDIGFRIFRQIRVDGRLFIS
jgi:hypothetical protein